MESYPIDPDPKVKKWRIRILYLTPFYTFLSYYLFHYYNFLFLDFTTSYYSESGYFSTSNTRYSETSWSLWTTPTWRQPRSRWTCQPQRGLCLAGGTQRLISHCWLVFSGPIEIYYYQKYYIIFITDFIWWLHIPIMFLRLEICVGL